MGTRKRFNRGKGPVAESTSILLRRQPIHIAAIKEAVGLDTLGCAFEMSMVHFEKRFEKTAKTKNILPVAWLLLAIGFAITGCMVKINL